MKFYFDESGDFAVPSSSGTHRVAVVVGIAVPDAIEGDLQAAYGRLVADLAPEELEDGEPKGSRLSAGHRGDFADLLTRFRGFLSLAPATLDLGSLAGLRPTNELLSDKLNNDAETMEHQTAREQMHELARQVRNLSPSQALRLYAWANCFRKSLECAILFRATGTFRDCWRNLRFEVDRVQVRSGTREERVLNFMLPAWLDGWSRRRPFMMVKGVHTPDTPLLQLYDTPKGFDLRRMLDGNVHFSDSRANPGLQMADIAASIVAQAATDLDDRNGSVTLFARLMRASVYGPRQGPGLFGPSAAPRPLRAKYRALSDAMERLQNSN